MDFYANHALRVNTKRTYSTHHRTFRRICSSIGVDPDLPLTERHLCAIVIIYAHTHRITTLPGFTAAIQNYAVSLSHPNLPRHRLYDRVRAGLNNMYGHQNFSQPRQGITINELCDFRTRLNLSLFADARDWCACLFAFYGLLRINEYCGGSLCVKHVTLHAWGISLIVPFSKTSLIPAVVDIIRRDDQLCPVAACNAYTALVNARYRAADHPFFLSSASSTLPMLDSQFIQRVRTLVRVALHRDPQQYAGHSFRRGGTTALLQAGVPEATIATHGRWKSLAYRSYLDVQHNLHMRLAATAQLSLHSRRAPLPGLVTV